MRTKIEKKKPEWFTIPTETGISWHFERVKKPTDKQIENYVLITPGAPDIAKVIKAYAHHPVEDYNIAQIEIVYNENLNGLFERSMRKMNNYMGNQKRASLWRTRSFALSNLSANEVETLKNLVGSKFSKIQRIIVSDPSKGTDTKYKDISFTQEEISDILKELANLTGSATKTISENIRVQVEEEKQQREDTYKKLLMLAQPYGDKSASHIKLLPLWHGTHEDIARKNIFNEGYGIFTRTGSTTDDGYFGRGVYTTHEAEYAFRAYAKNHGDKAVLLLNWVSIFEAYPVIGADGLKFQGTKGGYDECDTHFIPVYSDVHPTAAYYPCFSDQEPQYHEIVVFKDEQCLPRYMVKLVENAPKHSIDSYALEDYKAAFSYMETYRYDQVARGFEEAYDAGHPGAIIRLHWLHSGASGVISANKEALQKYQHVPKASLDVLESRANFRSENDSEAQFVLGWCYQHGLGTDKNPAKAAKYYWMAANQGHRDAQYQLGVCCSTGMGVKQDIRQAIVFYEKAAAQGHVHANYVLYQCYEWGLGVEGDPVKALEHKQAAQKGKHPQLVGIGGLPPTSSPNVALEQNIKRLESQLTEQVSKLKESELQRKQQKDVSDQDKQKLNELTQAVSAEKQVSRTKDEMITRQKQEKDEIVAKKEAELRDKEEVVQRQAQSLQDQTQKTTALSSELSKKEGELNVLKAKLSEIEVLRSKMDQLAKALAESKERENSLKMQFQAYPKQPQPGYSSPFFPSQALPTKPVVNAQQEEKQNQLIEAWLKRDLALIKRLEFEGASLLNPNEEKGKYSHQVERTSKAVEAKIDARELSALFKWVTEGHLVEVEKLLKKAPILGLGTGTITDLSERTFKNMTALQYAAWALDTEMCELIMSYLGAHNTSIQLKALSNESECYSSHGASYDMTLLINKTQTYLDNYAKWSSEERCRYWQKEVGGEQRKCPAWLIYAWSEEGVDVGWTKKDATRKINREYEKHKLEWWMTENYNNGRGVGSSWAVLRGDYHMQMYCVGGSNRMDSCKEHAVHDGTHLTGLSKNHRDAIRRVEAKADSELTQATLGLGQRPKQ